LYLGALGLRGVRWYWLLASVQRVPMPRVLRVSFISFGATVLLPFRIGELVRPSYMRQKEHVSWWAATGTVAAERVVDGLVLNLILFAALQLAERLPNPPDRIGELPVSVSVIPRAAYSALALFACAFVAMGLFYWRRAWMRATTERVVGGISRRLGENLAGALERLADGLAFLARWRQAAPFVALTLGYWSLSATGIWLLVWGVGLTSLTVAQGLAVLGVFALGFLAPNAPGFFGTFQLSIYAGLAMYFPPEAVIGPGSAAVFLLYVCQLGVVLPSTLVALLLEHAAPPAP